MLEAFLKHYCDRVNFIRRDFPTADPAERSRMRKETQDIRQWMGEMLEAWAILEEELAGLIQEHPELDGSDEDEIEEFWLDGQVVRTFRQGQGYYQLNMFQEAQPYFERVVDKDPEFLLGRVYLALSQFQREQWDEALRHLQLVAETANHDKFRSFAQHMMGCIQVKQGRDEQGIRHFEEVLKQDSDNGDAWFNLGACYYRLQEYHEAIPLFFHALKAGEGDWEAMYYLACCYEQVEQWESVAYWRMAAYEKTRSPDMMEEIARDFESSGDREGAVRWYYKLLRQDPKRVSAYHGISWHLWQQGHQEQALVWIKRALTLQPRDPDLLFTFVWFQLQEGDEGAIRQVMSRLPQSLADEPLWTVLRSRFHARVNELEQAKATALRLIERTGADGFTLSLGHYQLGRVLLQQQNPVVARDHFRQAIHHSPDWNEPLFFEGLCHWLEGNPDQAHHCWEMIQQTSVQATH